MIRETVEVKPPVPRDHALAPVPPAPPQTGSGRWWVWLIVLCAIGIAAYFLVPRLLHPQGNGTNSAAAGAAGRPVPVIVATARRGDMNLYLTGLGTVTAFNTVAVKPRVDGQIIKVSYVEGQIMKAGDPLVDIDPRPFQVQLTQAEGQLARDQALLRNAQLDLQRYQSVRTSVTQQQIDTQNALVAQYEGAVKSDQGQVDNVKLQLVYCHITAPIAGRIGLRLVDEGNIVHATDANPLAVITQLQPIAVVFTISEDDLARVTRHPNYGDGLPVDAFDRELKARIATGALLAVDNQVDATTGMVRLKGEFQNLESSLFPNQFVNARLLVDTLRDVVIVPAAAVQRGPDPDSVFVYVVNSDKKVELRNITVGETEGEDTVVEKGVAPGELVVTDGVDKLQQGTTVSVRPQASRRATGGASRPAGSAMPASRPSRGVIGAATHPSHPTQQGARPSTRPTTPEGERGP